MSAVLSHPAYAGSVLKPEIHSRLVASLEKVSRESGIPQKFICNSIKAYCDPAEIDYIKSFRTHDRYGYVYTGDIPDVTDRMMAMGGMLLRNFISVRLLTLQDLLSQLKDDNPPQETAVFIPNFFTSSKDPGLKKKTTALYESQTSALLGWLYSRQTLPGAQTILYVQDFDGLASDYGSQLAAHLDKNFYTHEA